MAQKSSRHIFGWQRKIGLINPTKKTKPDKKYSCDLDQTALKTASKLIRYYDSRTPHITIHKHHKIFRWNRNTWKACVHLLNIKKKKTHTQSQIFWFFKMYLSWEIKINKKRKTNPHIVWNMMLIYKIYVAI